MLSELSQQADAGDLWVDPAIAKHAHAAFEEWLGVLTNMGLDADLLGRPMGFPNLDSAQALAKKFEAKTIGPDSLQDRITKFINVGEQLRDLLLASVKKFADTDESFATYVADVQKRAEKGE